MGRIWAGLTGIAAGALMIDVLHRASHAPWRCDEDCRWWQVWPEKET